jgi:glucose/arabinose dehydrogenase
VVDDPAMIGLPQEVQMVVEPASSRRPRARHPRSGTPRFFVVVLCLALLAACRSGGTPTPALTRPATTATANPAPSPAGPLPPLPRIALKVELTGLRQPLYVTHASDGSGAMYVVEKAGAIRVARDGAIQPEPFLDITARVGSSGSEQGLLGLALHPDFAHNGYLFVDYTDVNGNTVIERYAAPGNRRVADPNSARTILTVDQPFPNHNGGQLAFGPDGMLWVGLGDGGSGGDPNGYAQNLSHLLGKILRIDVDHESPYAIPADNPFATDRQGRGEIWGYGLRNPWRFSFDRKTGDLYVGDVGQNAWEEVDFVPAGTRGPLNFGWNRMEGTHCFPATSDCDRRGLVLPIAEHQTGPDGCAVTGGYVYRGTRFPTLAGTYLYSDYCSGTIWALRRAADGHWVKETALAGSQTGAAGFSSFGEDEAGELYVTGLGDGIVYHIVVE